MLSFSAFCQGALFRLPFQGRCPARGGGVAATRGEFLPSGFAALTHLPSRGEAELSHSNCAA